MREKALNYTKKMNAVEKMEGGIRLMVLSLEKETVANTEPHWLLLQSARKWLELKEFSLAFGEKLQEDDYRTLGLLFAGGRQEQKKLINQFNGGLKEEIAKMWTRGGCGQTLLLNRAVVNAITFDGDRFCDTAKFAGNTLGWGLVYNILQETCKDALRLKYAESSARERAFEAAVNGGVKDLSYKNQTLDRWIEDYTGKGELSVEGGEFFPFLIPGKYYTWGERYTEIQGPPWIESGTISFTRQ